MKLELNLFGLIYCNSLVILNLLYHLENNLVTDNKECILLSCSQEYL